MAQSFPARATVERLRAQYPAGLRVKLVSMNDPYTKLRPGDKGTVDHVDDIGTVFVNWDSGSGLGVAYGEDRISILPPCKDAICRRCGGPLYPSEIEGYVYQCFCCDEDYYGIEVIRKPEVQA